MSDDELVADSDATDAWIEDIIERWHKGEYGDKPLTECLSMTWEEYAAWVERPSIEQLP